MNMFLKLVLIVFLMLFLNFQLVKATEGLPPVAPLVKAVPPPPVDPCVGKTQMQCLNTIECFVQDTPPNEIWHCGFFSNMVGCVCVPDDDSTNGTVIKHIEPAL